MCSVFADDELENTKAQVLTKTSHPLLYALAESLENKQLAKDIDIGELAALNEAPVQIVTSFLKAFQRGDIPNALFVSQAQLPLAAYLRTLQTQGLRFKTFRIGMSQPQDEDMLLYPIKLMGYGQRTLGHVVIKPIGAKWGIIALNIEFPREIRR